VLVDGGLSAKEMFAASRYGRGCTLLDGILVTMNNGDHAGGSGMLRTSTVRLRVDENTTMLTVVERSMSQ